MPPNSRQLARTWPYPRHRRFVAQVRNVATAWFRAQGFDVDRKYAYILADRDDWPNNILLSEVVTYIQTAAETQRSEGRNFPLHKYVHHGLSSQAMLFNLVGPLLVRNDLGPLKRVLSRKGVHWPDGNAQAIFEYEDRIVFSEDSGQPTSIDLAILDNDGSQRIFLEAKFTENKFGGCSVFGAGDCDGRNPAADLDMCYLHHIGRRYWSLMQQFGLDCGEIRQDSQCILANHYQFFRELLFALVYGGVFILLCDDRSPVFYCDGPQGERGLMPHLLGLLPPHLRDRVGSVTVQELVAEIVESGNHDWVDDFKTKYGLAS